MPKKAKKAAAPKKAAKKRKELERIAHKYADVMRRLAKS